MIDRKLPTLRVKWPFGATLALAAGILLCLIVSSEFLLRRDFIQSKLPYPSIGSSNRSLDVKVHLLHEMVKRQGPPDCIFLGNSLVNSGIDPEAFREAFQSITGKSIRCFNFGINAMTPYSAIQFADILVRAYHPRMIVWGITPSDFHTRRKTKEVMLETNAWVRYRLGDGNFSGWLADKSYIYRYYLRFRFWLEYPKIFHNHTIEEAKSTPTGFRPDQTRNVIDHPIDAERHARYKDILSQLKVDTTVFSILKQSFSLDPGTFIVLVEMPTHPACLSFYPGGEKTHYELLEKVKGFAGKNGVLFIPVTHLNLFKDKKWRDYTHLNVLGAQIYSRWLGKKIGKAVKKGAIPGFKTGG